MRHFRKTLGLTAGRAGAAPLLVAPLLVAPLLVIALAHPAGALVITPTFETGMPQAARDAIVNIVIPEFQTLFANPVTVSIEFDWGDTAGQAFDTGASTLFAKFPGYSLATAEQLLSQAATAVSPANAVLNAALAGNQPATFPAGSGGSLFFISDPQLQALTGSASASYGPEAYVGFASNFCGTGSSCVYDYTGGVPAANAIDFVAVAEHELSEIMGRAQGLGTKFDGSNPAYLPFDLLRYKAAGLRSLGMTDGSSVYFSLDSGTTNLKGFNAGALGVSDFSDWASGANDSFNAFTSSGVKNDITPVDITTMDVIGYTLAPEPSSLVVGAFVLMGGLLGRRRARR